MGYLLIILSTLSIIFVIMIRQIKRKHGFLKNFKKLIIEINKTYLGIFKQNGIIKVSLSLVLIIIAELFTFLSISTAIYRYFNVRFLLYTEPIIKGLLSIGSFIMVFYLIGYILLFTSKIHGFIRKTENLNFRIDFIISYFLISTYLTVMLIFPKEFNKIGTIVLIGVIFCYLLNMKLLINLMINPKKAKSKEKEEISFSRIIITAILILVMILLNLYLAVCVIEGLTPGAFAHSDGYFSLFYYTIITFTTIGYGDIVPVTVAARTVAIVISITSVISLTVFLSSILSYREKFQ